jgi:hypothetical protein
LEYPRDIYRLEYPGADGVNNIKMDSKQTGCDGVDWIHPDEERIP